MIEHTPKPQPMSNRKEVREQLLKQAGWVKLPNGKHGPAENLACNCVRFYDGSPHHPKCPKFTGRKEQP